MGRVLTIKAVEAAKPTECRVEIPDGGLKGLYLVVQPSGVKGWALRYRHAGKSRKLSLGRYPIVGLADARERATEALKLLDSGVDPRTLGATASAEAAPDEGLFEQVVEQFVAKHAKRKNRTWAETERILKREALPYWAERSIEQILKRDVIDLIDAIVDRGAPTMANRTFAAMRKFFAWAVERDMIPSSPCSGLRPPAPEVKRDRVLSEIELVAVWRAAERLGPPFGPMIKLLILTGQRRDEVARALWSEFDLAAAMWTIPAARAKNNRAHTVPLSPEAAEIVQAQPRIAASGKGVGAIWLFTTTGDTPVSGFGRMKKRLDEEVAAHLAGERFVPQPPLPWRLHDIRRTVATGMAALGVQLPVVERILNHTSGSFGGVVGVYQRHEFLEERRAALEGWARHVAALVERAPK
ncbi:tyrosine-type recombinase/integrase [Caenispirillum bisanense]|uniref:Site-specific recombinase XerD n=1 Tax=Caenispirillum bisanense TaxID=414052 RepID=A0A286H243_9PROT|nr:site-specific integrase [Caenispirillum bisanense]SOE01762.1 Site-specific recombinase XerD [Caenispirillum bisanense]